MKKIVTVSRQFGSGGHIIAQKVAESLGWKYYDRELIEKICQETGLAKEFVESNDDSSSGPRHVLCNPSAYFGWVPVENSVLDKMYVAQYNIINEMAEEGNCVIIGRCAGYVLRERADCLKVFVHADIDFRAERAVSYGVEAKNMKKFIEECDRKRKSYYRYNADCEWTDALNYDLCLDSKALGIDKCADIIISSLS